MDPIAHTFVGASLAQTGLRRTTPYGAAALIAGANLPDIDAIVTVGGSDVALWWRRGWTHGVPALIVLPLVLTVILVLLGRYRGRPVRPGVLLALSYFATWTHPTLDWMNTYGMRWLMPVDGRWFYGDTLFIVDPWIWTALGGAVFLAGVRRPRSFLLWGGFAAFTAFLLFTVVPGLVPAKILWCALVAAIVVLRWRGVGRDERSARRWALGTLFAVTAYILVLGSATRWARGAVEEAMTARGAAVDALMVGPVPVTPLVRDVVVQTPEGYYYGRAHLWPAFELELAPEPLPLLDDSPIVRAATASPRIRGFMNWARFPFAEVEEGASSYTVYLSDARYTRTRGSGFGSARVEIPKPKTDTNGN
jgi:inner membrane protein